MWSRSLFWKSLSIVHLIFFPYVIAVAAGGAAPPPQPPASAIFVVNHAGTQYDGFAQPLKDNLTSLLTQKGLSIVRTENLMPPQGLTDSNEDKSTEAEAEASITRIAESLNARLLILATINSVTHDELTFDGSGTIYKTSNKTAMDSVRINLQVYEVGSSTSKYGDSVNTSLRAPLYGQTESQTVLINLFHDASLRLADNIVSHVSSLNANASAPSKHVSFTVSSNAKAADVFVDGLVVGSVGEESKFLATPGIHQLKIGKNFLKTWEKTVNITDGAKFAVELELSAEGLKIYKDIKSFNLAMRAGETAIDIAKKQNDAEATATVEVAKGERKKRENSSVKDDGFADSLKKVIHGD